MRVIVIGCGRVGSTLSYKLDKNKDTVVVIDKNPAAFDNLPADFQGRTIAGDVLDRAVLHRAEIEKAEALAAVTNSDSLNALVAHIAHTEFKVSKVVARNYDPRQWQLQSAFNVPIIGSALWGAERIQDLLTELPILSVFSDPSAGIEVCQLIVTELSGGRSFREVFPSGKARMLSLARSGQQLEASDSAVLEIGDLVYLSTNAEEIQRLQERMGSRKEQSR